MEKIQGQQRAIDVLQSALRADRLHHAYIFHGPPGVGKFTTALAFAHILLCHDARTDLVGNRTACGTCESCRILAAEGGIHPDLHIVTKELACFSDKAEIRDRKLMSIPVEVLRRGLIDPVNRAARLRHNKVFLVDEAELLQGEGQNLLLKTLEEPPAGTYLVLVTASEDRLLPTVRSRCQRVAFVPLPRAVVEDWIDRQGEALDDSGRQWLISFAGGSLGTPRLALDYDLLSWAKCVLPALDAMAEGRYAPELGAQIAEMIDTFAKQWVDKHENASKDAANRRGAALMGSIITDHARQRLRESAGRCDPGDPGRAETILDPHLGVIDAVVTAEHEVRNSVNLGLVCDHLVSLMYRALSRSAAA